MKKEDTIVIRTDEAFKEEFKLYFGNMSEAIISLMEEALERRKREIFSPVIEELKGNRYVSASVEAAVWDIVYHRRNGLSDEEIGHKIKNLLVEKFEFSPDCAERFFNTLYRDVYRGNIELLVRHSGRLVEFFRKETGGGADV